MGQNKPSESFVRIFSHNVRGLQKDEYVEEVVGWLRHVQGYVACLQESWRLCDTIEQHKEFLILNHGPLAKLCRRGSLGVTIVLGWKARRDWETAGSQVLHFGLRIMAVRLHSKDGKGKVVKLFVVNAYSPIGAAPAAEREAYAAQFQLCFNACGKDEVFIACSDTNASAGVRDKRDDPYAPGRDKVRGPYGINYQNAAGRELCTLLGANELCLPTTYFPQRKASGETYGTWQNPCSKRYHQLDQFIMRQKDLKRVCKAKRFGLPSKDSDHWTIFLQVRLGKTLKLLHKVKSTEQELLQGEVHNATQLNDQTCRLILRFASEEIQREVHNATQIDVATCSLIQDFAYEEPKAAPVRINRSLLQDPAVAEAFRAKTKSEMSKQQGGRTKLQHLQESMRTAATATLESKERVKGWFEARKHILLPVIVARNTAQATYHAHPSDVAKARLKLARKQVKKEVAAAEKFWFDGLLQRIEGMGSGPSAAKCWAAITDLRGGKSVTKKVDIMKLKKPDGTLCATPADNAKTMSDYLGTVFNKTGTFDQDAIDKVRQRDPKQWTWMIKPPTDEETTKAIRKMGTDKSGADAECPAEYFKALEGDEDTRQFLRDAFDEYWKSGSFEASVSKLEPEPQPIPPEPPPQRRSSRRTCLSDEALIAIANKPLPKPKHSAPAPSVPDLPARDPDADKEGMEYEEWLIARMKILPKKGDLSLCKNWRAICLLDIASKILSTVIVARMQLVQEQEGLEDQNGFRGLRGTIDGLFNTCMALLKRKEHNLETWALFIDLVKAFDTVSREALFQVLRKFGFPDHFINIVIRLHTGATMKFSVGDTEASVPSKIGVRQGSCEGPTLFLFIMQAALETMEWPVAKPQFCTRKAGELTGARTTRVRGVTHFDLFQSLFADDCALLFNSRQDLITGANYIYHHLRKFGLLMHIGKGETPSKTEAVFFPAPRQDHNSGDQSDFDVHDGFVSFSSEFRYLGAIIHHSLTSDTDINKRIAKATAAFGALRGCLFSSKKFNLKDKGKVYTVLVLTILLYGSECWCLREDLFRRLRVFHNTCMRSMCRITMRQVRRHRISNEDLQKRLGIKAFDFYYNTRMLRWAGHLARMPMTRMPRRLLTSWVRNARPRGAPQMTFGRTLNKALKSADLPTEFSKWTRKAQDRAMWRKLSKNVQ